MPSSSSTAPTTNDAAALALLHQRADTYRINTQMTSNGEKNVTITVYSKFALKPPYHFFHTIVPASRILNPPPHGYTTYAGVYDRSANRSRSFRRMATDPGTAAAHIAGRAVQGKGKRKAGQANRGLAKYDKKPKDGKPDNLCATRALIQAITHFDGPDFIRKLGAARLRTWKTCTRTCASPRTSGRWLMVKRRRRRRRGRDLVSSSKAVLSVLLLDVPIGTRLLFLPCKIYTFIISLVMREGEDFNDSATWYDAVNVQVAQRGGT